ncbi:MAG TPA: hypothetical protein VGQ37_04935 [Vicinamibacterales bacterium]|jgi:hypothetical protein|nr:hypothetical protein [Vicinamibacterales bacterium]
MALVENLPQKPGTAKGAAGDDERYESYRGDPSIGTTLALAAVVLWVGLGTAFLFSNKAAQEHTYLILAILGSGPLAIALEIASMRQYYRYRAAVVQLIKARREKQEEAEKAIAAAKAKEKEKGTPEPKPKDPVLSAVEQLADRVDGNTTAITNAITSLESKVLKLPGQGENEG